MVIDKVECYENYDIKRHTSFKTGGVVNKIFFPKTIEEFCIVIKSFPDSKVFGNFSNTLVSSDGFDGSVICTSKMDYIIQSGTKLVCGAGVKGPLLSKTAMEKGLSGVEFMIGFPGSVGGEVFMNASAHGQAAADVVKKVKLFAHDKGVFELADYEMEFDYRTSICQKKLYYVLEAEFELTQASNDDISKKMTENLEFRKNHQPSLRLPNCGSVFKNPTNSSAGRLLEQAGAKGLSHGGVRVWENHANFIINDNNGTSTDVLELMFKMYTQVKEMFGIELVPEVRYLGSKNVREDELCRILYQK